MSHTIDTINPSTEEVINTFELMTLDEASKTLENVHHAFREWSHVAISQRAKILNNFEKLLGEHEKEIASMMSDEMGKPFKQGIQEVELCKAICSYYAENAEKFLKDEEKDIDGGRALVSYNPLGVIFGIAPWNFPLYQVVRFTVPNLMAGNTIMFKHAQNVWGVAKKIEELFLKAGFPQNTVRHLYVDHEISSELMKSKLVRGVNFTGSDEAGKKVASEASKNLKKTVLELGGSDPYLILEDADIEKAAKTCVEGRIINNGETCTAAKRFIVHAKVYDEFKEYFIEGMKKLKYGNPKDESNDFGPLARKDLREKLHSQVEDSVSKGAKILLGGKLPSEKGYFYPATVLENLSPGMPAYDDELFGPVASLIKVQSEEEAIEVANSSRYGLGGGVFSQDEKRAIEIAKNKIEVGMCNVNGYNLAQPNLPFGGIKDSGYGREHGRFGIHEFMNIKTLIISK